MYTLYMCTGPGMDEAIYISLRYGFFSERNSDVAQVYHMHVECGVYKVLGARAKMLTKLG